MADIPYIGRNALAVNLALNIEIPDELIKRQGDDKKQNQTQKNAQSKVFDKVLHLNDAIREKDQIERTFVWKNHLVGTEEQ